MSKTFLPQHIRFGREICGQLPEAERREWWLANGAGAYAAGTIAGTLTRRYHGLLIAPVHPPTGRMLVFAKADATLIDGGRSIPLFANRWRSDVVNPAGNVHIESFRLDGRIPVWRYAAGDVLIEQRIWMEQVAPADGGAVPAGAAGRCDPVAGDGAPDSVRGRTRASAVASPRCGAPAPRSGAHTTYVAFRLVPGARVSARPLALSVALLINARDHHGSMRAPGFDVRVDGDAGVLRVRHADFTLQLVAVGGELEARHDWYENFDLPVERERGLPDDDNHLCVGVATLPLREGEWVGVVGSLGEASTDLASALARRERYDSACLARAHASCGRETPWWFDQLALAADSFVFARPLAGAPSPAPGSHQAATAAGAAAASGRAQDGESVIAGFPWFGDWGRDTMIALPGLTLAVGRADTALRILRTFARFIDRGMLPNVFPGAGETADYNTVDAGLWYFEAWRAYVDATGDFASLSAAFPVLADMIEWHLRGTRYGIGVDAHDGLLRAGEAGVQITWMDSKIGDWVVTPRIGKPVEINALWFNALCAMAQFAHALGSDGARYRELADAARAGFERFRRPDGTGLYDVIDGPEGDDASLRPNQILAVSLAFSPLEKADQAQVVAAVAGELLTSYGLRSLAPSHPAYRGNYLGRVWERDGSYHQGPVWPWLLGHYALAEYRVTGDARAARRRLEPLADHLFDAGLGTVSEILDGAPPHWPRGCPSQAWSVGCALEAWWRIGRAEQSRAAGTLRSVAA